MGTWGITAFEDDTAMGFYDDFCFGAQSIEELESHIDKVLETNYAMSGDLLMDGFTDPVKALVSAEIIAAAIGKPVAQMPDDEYHNPEDEDIDPVPPVDLSKLSTGISGSLLEKCRKCVAKIRDTSGIHLRELWAESESFEEWKAYLSDLSDRLSAS